MDTPRPRVALVLPRRRLWGWHRELAALLAEKAEVTVFAVDGRGYPIWLEGWLAIERRLFGGTARTRRLSHIDSEPGRPEPSRFDAVVDLSEANPSAEALALLYDGSPDSLTLMAALLGGRAPRLQVSRGPKALAGSYPAIRTGSLTAGLSLVFARALALVERALAGASAPATEAAPQTTARPSPVQVAALAGEIATSALANRLRGGRLRPEHWTIGWRRLRDGAPFPPETSGFTAAPIVDSGFWADPFVISREDATYVFAEAYPYATNKGVIAWARLTDEGLSSFATALERPYHLSYPYLFEYEDGLFMIPETGRADAVELYRCVEFPGRWELDRVLMKDVRLKDVTVFEHGGRWWMLAAAATHGGSSMDELFGWHADTPFGPWSPHPLNPLVSDVRLARPAGRPVLHAGRLYRPAQDCEASYGAGLVWCEITDLSPTTYEERPVARWSGADFGPYTGVHTYNTDGRFEVVDLKQTIRTPT